MIERLITNLDALTRCSSSELMSASGKRMAADCADAIRLELDCPQQELTTDQRHLLSALGDLLDPPADALAIRALAITVQQAFGMNPSVTFRRATNADCSVD